MKLIIIAKSPCLFAKTAELFIIFFNKYRYNLV